MDIKKDFRKINDHPINSWVNYDTKKALYEIVEQENITMSELIRRFVMKGVEEYGRKETEKKI